MILEILETIPTNLDYPPGMLKGTFQRKLTWVETRLNRLAWDCGAGHYFFSFLLRRHLLFSIFPFPEYIVNYWCTELFSANRQRGGRIWSANTTNSQIFFIRRASPFSGVNIAAPRVLALHKGHERIGEARKNLRSAVPIGAEIT